MSRFERNRVPTMFSRFRIPEQLFDEIYDSDRRRSLTSYSGKQVGKETVNMIHHHSYREEMPYNRFLRERMKREGKHTEL